MTHFRTRSRALGAGLLAVALALPAAAQVRPGGGGFGGSSNNPPASDDAFLYHVLRRTTFGPTTESLAEIRAMGADAWLWRQLHPQTIDDAVLDARLRSELPPMDLVADEGHPIATGSVQLAHLPMALSQVGPGPAVQNVTRGLSLLEGVDYTVDYQVGVPTERVITFLPARMGITWSNNDNVLVDYRSNEYQWGELSYEFLQRSMSSNKQLEAVMTQFWENHFDTSIEHGGNDDQWHEWALMEAQEDAAFRANAFGRFRDLLEISAKSAAMMWFLDNYQNTVRMSNENYARELLELHSLSVDCGYDQFDVEQVARIFSGWSASYFARVPPDPCGPGEVPPACDPNDYVEGGFLFDRGAHDLLPKPNPSDPDNVRPTVLGTTFPAGQGLAEGLRVLDIVSEHPCTAQFISRKLINLFVMDDPTEEYVDRIATEYLAADGDTREVLWAIFKSPEFRDPANFGGKIKQPLEQTLSTLRAVEGQVNTSPRGFYDGYEWHDMFWVVWSQGQQLFRFGIPTGYPEVGGGWISSNGLLERWQYADGLMFSTPRPGAEISTDPMAVLQRLRLTDADAILDHYSRLILGGKLSDERRQILRPLLVNPGSGRFEPADPGQTWRLRETISNMLGFPESIKQ